MLTPINRLSRVVSRRGSLPTLILVFGIAFAPAALPSLYKWVDDEGGVHYSQTRPGDRPAQAVKIRSRPSPVEDQQAEDEDSAAAHAKASSPDVMRTNCDVAKANLEKLESGVDVTEPGADGKAVLLDEGRREIKTQQMTRLVALYCK